MARSCRCHQELGQPDGLGGVGGGAVAREGQQRLVLEQTDGRLLLQLT